MATSSRQAVLASTRRLRLHEFDWDGVAGLPLRGDVADTIYDLYTEEGIGDAMDLALPVPTVSMNSNGTIEVVYDDDSGRKLLLTFECQGVVTYIKVFEDEQTTVEGVIRFDTLDTDPDDFVELTELFAWLIEE